MSQAENEKIFPGAKEVAEEVLQLSKVIDGFKSSKVTGN
jgi:hypothetical protein